MALPLLGRDRGHRRQKITITGAGSQIYACHGDNPISVLGTVSATGTCTVEYSLDSWSEAEGGTAVWVGDGTTYTAGQTTAGLIQRPVNAIRITTTGTGNTTVRLMV